MLDMPTMTRAGVSDTPVLCTRSRTMTTRILIVDEQPIVRRGLSSLFRSEPDFEVVDDVGSYASALQAFRASHPRVVTVDVVLEDGSGLELIRELTAIEPLADVIVCSMHDERLYAERALRAGAKGFVSKRESPERIVTAIRRVLEGRIYLSEQMTDRMLCRTIGSSNDPMADPIASLSDRELEVFEQLGRGVTTRLIAEKLHLSPKTVETYRENIKSKLNLRNAMELTQHAVQWVLQRG